MGFHLSSSVSQVLSGAHGGTPALAPGVLPWAREAVAADGQPGHRGAARINRGFSFAAQLRILSDLVLTENSQAEWSGRGIWSFCRSNAEEFSLVQGRDKFLSPPCKPGGFVFMAS